MNLDKILMILVIVLAVASAFVAVPMGGLALLVVGLVMGGMSPLDSTERTAYLLFAFAGPTVANSLDAIPVVGAYVNTIIDGVAAAAAGAWAASLLRSLVDRVKP
jgi:hypothetical protein